MLINFNFGLNSNNACITRVKAIITKLQNKVKIFDGAVIICNNFQDSEDFFDLTKESMKIFSDRKKAIKQKIESLLNTLSIIQNYAITLVNVDDNITPNSTMNDTEYYKIIGDDIGIDTQFIMDYKKACTKLYLALAYLRRANKHLKNVDKKVLRKIAFGAYEHHLHQQSCNGDELLPYIYEATKEVRDELGFDFYSAVGVNFEKFKVEVE